ncbi:MAG: Z1 domain-containing protein, partial [Acidobacteriaceae bacterium]
ITDHVFKGQPGGWMPDKHKKDHVPLYRSQRVPPPSLIAALRSFVLACAARACRGQALEHASMLVHVTRFVNVQKEVHDQVAHVMNRMRQQITQRVDHEDLFAELHKLWVDDFIPTSKKVAALLPEVADTLPIPDWSDILAALPDVVRDITVRIVNGTAKDALDYSERDRIGLKVIAIGGDKLSRGLTLEGLCTSYFVRTTKMYDTLMQMGRWFGYRPGYVDLCRLYTSEDLVDWFGHIADASEELREEFEAMAERNATPENYGLRIQSHPVLLVTSPLKMRTAKNLQLSFSGELLETVSLYKDSALLARNLAVTNRLISAMGAPSEESPIRVRNGAEQNWKGSYLWDAVAPDPIADFFEAYATHPNARKVNSKLLSEFVHKMAKSGELTSWTVVLLGGGLTGHSHTFETKLKVDMLQRKDESPDRDRYSIGRLLSPRDEAIDLKEPAWTVALAATVRGWNADATKQRRGTEAPVVPNGPAIRRVRGKGAEGIAPTPERGLLLLYPLAPQAAGGTGFGSYQDPVIAFGVSFPASDGGVKVQYTVDHLLWEQEYGSGE